MALILDTNAVSALFDGDLALAAVLERSPRLALPTIVVGEYRFGLLRSRHRAALEPMLERLIRESGVLVVDAATASAYAETREELRRLGRPMPENDVWIAALARQHGLAVASRDGHLDQVPGLRRVRW